MDNHCITTTSGYFYNAIQFCYAGVMNRQFYYITAFLNNFAYIKIIILQIIMSNLIHNKFTIYNYYINITYVMFNILLILNSINCINWTRELTPDDSI